MKLSEILELAYIEAFRRWARAYKEMTDLPKNDTTLQQVRDTYEEMVEIHKLLNEAREKEI